MLTGNLSQAEKDIYNKVIKGNESILSQVLKKDPQINRSRRKKDKVKKVPEKKNELIDGQEYEVNGKILNGIKLTTDLNKKGNLVSITFEELQKEKEK